MGVDYYTCGNCRGTYPDCGPCWRCEKGHGIGPCCLDDRNQYKENDDGELLSSECPCCQSGGTELERAKADLRALQSQLDEARGLLAEAAIKLYHPHESDVPSANEFCERITAFLAKGK